MILGSLKATKSVFDALLVLPDEFYADDNTVVQV